MLIFQEVNGLLGFETLKIGHTRTNTHISGRQLKIKFLDVFNYYEYSDTNVSKKKNFHDNIASSMRKQKLINYNKLR